VLKFLFGSVLCLRLSVCTAYYDDYSFFFYMGGNWTTIVIFLTWVREKDGLGGYNFVGAGTTILFLLGS
jgi:hypothetical protein